MLVFLGSHDLIECHGVVVIDVLVHSRLESLHQLRLDLLFDVRSNEGLLFADAITSFGLLFDRHQLLFALQLHLAHAN